MTDGLTTRATDVARFCGSCGAPRDAASTNFCRACGVPYADSDKLEPRAASLAFATKVGFWRRAFAYLLDSLVLGALGFVMGFVVSFAGSAAGASVAELEPIIQIAANVIGFAYFVFLWSAAGKGQTLGMRWLGIRVVRTDGSYMGLGRSFMRALGLGLSFLVLFIGVIWVAFDKNKQGWHDKMADTYVVRA